MLTLYYGEVGSGKTQAMVRDARRAYEAGQPVFTNIDLDPKAGKWAGSDRGPYFGSPKKFVECLSVLGRMPSLWPEGCGAVVRWREPMELIELLDGFPAVRCGLVLFDELGAIVNNRESDYWPFSLTVKLIEHRKDHLDFVASAQVADMADKNMVRFYNRCYRCRERRVPLLGWIFPSSRRPDCSCKWPECRKDHGIQIRGDRMGWGTYYSLKDVDPKRTGNLSKHMSLGTKRILFDKSVALAYGTVTKVSDDAMRWHDRAVADYERHRGGNFGRQQFRRASPSAPDGARGAHVPPSRKQVSVIDYINKKV